MSDYASTSYFYSSTTSTSDAGAPVGQRYSTASTIDKDGTTIVRTARQDMGRPVVIEERRYDRSGQEELLPPVTEVAGAMVPSSPAPATPIDVVRRITDLDDETASYGDDTGMAIYALGTQDGTMWDGTNRGRARYVVPCSRLSRDGSETNVIRVDTSETGTTRKEYEDPSTGARVRKESEIDMSMLL